MNLDAAEGEIERLQAEALSALLIGGLVWGAVAGGFALPVTVLEHEISELLVIANGLRMLRA